MRNFLAHTTTDTNGQRREHELNEHLREVGALAASFAQAFGAEPWARLAGLWHDLGKYRDGFQKYIRSVNGPEAHLEGKVSGPDKTHSTAGALHAIGVFRKTHGKNGELVARVLVYLIASHHAGLYDWTNDKGEKQDLCDRLFEFGGKFREAPQREYQEALAHAPADVLNAADDFDPVASHALLRGLSDNPIAYAFAVRMIFSCLVDADFLDTERFMDPDKFQARSRNIPSIDALHNALDRHIAQRDTNLAAQGRAHSPVNLLRANVLAQCRSKAAHPRGFFSLEVPTGGGKTLSSLAFALGHAAQHGMRGVIYAIPYTSIIEQTADVFRTVFAELGEAAVIEYHSQVDSDSRHETSASRLACENWDAPLVVTTNVQLFESLFAARTSQCRKLHRLANSVIVLDEAQQLPPQFLQPILDALNLLVGHYGATVVLCTATQPVLQSTEYFDARRNLRGLPTPIPIVDNSRLLFDQLKRVKVHLPTQWEERRTLADLAQDIAAHDCVLTIVDRKADARELHRLLPPDTLHLSTLMCGAHRADTLALIRQRLDARRKGEDVQPLRVVSTQLVEAGVDLDFPVVYRAMAGLDSIAQAAGRCNREGLLECGQVFVFVPPQEAPPGSLRKAAQTTRSVLHGRPDDPLTPDLFREYFRHFYAGCDLDAKGIVPLLQTRSSDFAVKFRSAAKAFRLIDEDNVPVLVRYRGPDGTDETVDQLLGILARDGISRWLMRKLQRYAVMLYRTRAEALAAQGAIAPATGLPDWYVQQSDLLYHPVLGLDPNDAPYSPTGYFAG